MQKSDVQLYKIKFRYFKSLQQGMEQDRIQLKFSLA